ncbi:MAG: phosphoglucosamine mutase [Candidatus Howiella sp.]|jgi:phosphoglucosamine mutase
MGRLFGTDGARGVANTELTCELAMNIGRAAALVLTRHQKEKAKVLIGKDTRISSNMLEAALVAGFCSVGVDVLLAGFVPTPAVAYLVGEYGADAGVMISASHNPCEYNGIKLFDRRGFKLPDALEEEIETIVLDSATPIPAPIGGEIGRVTCADRAVPDYIEHISRSVGCRLDGMRIALDCANGSSSVTARELFEGLGATVFILSDTPDGVNINKKCGSTHMEQLCAFVREREDIALGLAFDGDADRCLAVDERGEPVDGDRLIAIFAKALKEEGRLKGNTAVVTVMTNIGFLKFAEENGIAVETTKVGDRYVLENMLQNDFSIGGEQSGHIIFKDYASTGDGQLSGAMFAAVLAKTGKTASQLASVMRVYPQVLLNVTVTPEGKAKWDSDPEIAAAIRSAEEELGENGRILVRVSGTEPLIRVMVEGEDQAGIERIADRVAAVIKERAV